MAMATAMAMTTAVTMATLGQGPAAAAAAAAGGAGACEDLRVGDAPWEPVGGMTCGYVEVTGCVWKDTRFKAGYPLAKEACCACGGGVSPMKVGVIGAGMAGLYAGMLLDSLGVEYEVLEAAPEAGGRVWTYHFSDADWDYVDLGAMRFPNISVMERVVGTVPWSLVSKITASGKAGRVALGTYKLDVDAELVSFNGVTKRAAAVGRDWAGEDVFNFSEARGGTVKDRVFFQAFNETSPSVVYNSVLAAYVGSLRRNFTAGFEQLMAIDGQSMRDLLMGVVGDEAAVTMMETYVSSTNLFDKAATESIIDELDFMREAGQQGSPWLLVEGGTSMLTKGMVAMQRPGALLTRHAVERIAPVGGDAGGAGATGVAVWVKGQAEARQYTHVVSTTTTSALRRIDTAECGLSTPKRTALRAVEYDHSVKVALKFSRRFWADEGIDGGVSSTDLPLRKVVYPSYGDANSSGVIIASYTWAGDAEFIGNAARADEAWVLRACVGWLAELHGRDRGELDGLFVEGVVQDWAADPHAQGAFAMFGPGQFSTLFPALREPEVGGRLVFAGEHTSVHHAWIVGSLNSAYRAVDEVLAAAGLEGKREALRAEWGPCAEAEDVRRGRDPREGRVRRAVARLARLGGEGEEGGARAPCADTHWMCGAPLLCALAGYRATCQETCGGCA